MSAPNWPRNTSVLTFFLLILTTEITEIQTVKNELTLVSTCVNQKKKKAAKNILSSLLHILQVFQGFSHLIFGGISYVHKVWEHTSFLSLHAAQPIAMVTSLLHQVLEIHFDFTLDFANSKLTVDKSKKTFHQDIDPPLQKPP